MYENAYKMGVSYDKFFQCDFPTRRAISSQIPEIRAFNQLNFFPVPILCLIIFQFLYLL